MRCSKEFRTAIFMQFRDFASQTEVGEFGMAVRRHHNIVWLDVTMDDLFFLPSVFQGRYDFHRNTEHLLRGDSSVLSQHLL